MKWLAEMEYGVFKIPKPDAICYLNVPIPIVLKLIKERNKKIYRNYLGKKGDVHEKDVKFLENSRKSALWLVKTQKGWIKIKCTSGGKIDTRANIHKKIYEKIKKVII